MTLVHQLPENLANKIAAGEVVERPASVIKELVENSLDAGADRIEIQITAGGLESMVIDDNGAGMAPDDAELAIKSHATSKINDEYDLFRVATFGFRGEALPAIASVSRLDLRTKRQEDSVGRQVVIHGGKLIESGSIGTKTGTRIEVRDLFYNTPARLKFLKTHRTEFAWIKESVIRLSLPHPNVFFHLLRDGKTVLKLDPVNRIEDRFSQLLGLDPGDLIHVRENLAAAGVEAWISPPSQAKTSTKYVYSFVNQRYVRDKLIMGALAAGCQGRLDRGRYPAAVILLDIEPGAMDVNVHPAKLEVRFRHQQAVSQAIRRTVAAALSTAESGRRFEATWSPSPSRPTGSAMSPAPGSTSQRDYSGFESGNRGSGSSPLAAYAEPGPSFGYIPPRSEPIAPSLRRPMAEDIHSAPSESILEAFRYIGQYADCYLVGQADGELILVDQHAAHERILYNKLRSGGLESQPLLFSASAALSPSAAAGLTDYLELLTEFGFEVEPFGPDGLSYKVNAVPALLTDRDPAELLEETIDLLLEADQDDPMERIRLALARMACRSAVMAGKELSEAEAEALIDQIKELPPPLTCPHGRPIIKRYPRNWVDREFRRT